MLTTSQPVGTSLPRPLARRRLLWGGATASSQYEGAFDTGGKGLDTQDVRPYLPRTSNATTATRLLTRSAVERAKNDSQGTYPFRTASNGYEHLDEDIALLKELGIDITYFETPGYHDWQVWRHSFRAFVTKLFRPFSSCNSFE